MDIKNNLPKIGEIVTVELEDKNMSNTYIVYDILSNREDDQIILHHPLVPNIYIIKKASEINKTAPIMQDSYEKCIRFALINKDLLSWEDRVELQAIACLFVFYKNLTINNKQNLSNICGRISSIKFDNDIQAAMKSIVENQVLLDDFNKMWFNNFSKIFDGSTTIKSKKQRAAIFNISGFILAELNNPKATIQEK